MKKRLNILVLSSWYPNRKDRLDGNFIQNHVQALAIENDITVVFATSYPTENQQYEFETNESEHIKEIYVYFPTHRYKLIRFFRKIKAYWIGIRRVETVDLIHANIFFYIGFLAVITAVLMKKKLFITENSSQFLRLTKWEKGFFRIFHPFVDIFFPVSSFLKDKFIALGVPESKIKVAFNTIEVDNFKILEVPKQQEYRFLHISRFDREIKNVKGILEATKKLHKTYHDFRLEIIGDGVMDDLNALIDEVGISRECLIITGIIENHLLPKYYAQSDCFILFSHFENNPLVLIEALCSGVPVIASRVGGIPDFVNEENGILVADNDVSGLYEAMKSMYLKQKSYHAADIRDSIVRKVSPKYVSAYYNDIFHAVLNR